MSVDFSDLPVPNLDSIYDENGNPVDDAPMSAPALVRSNATVGLQENMQRLSSAVAEAVASAQPTTKKARAKAKAKRKPTKKKRDRFAQYDSDYDSDYGTDEYEAPAPKKTKREKKPKKEKDPNKPPSTHRWQMHLRAFRAANAEECAGKSCAAISMLARASYLPRPKCTSCGK